jgi:hypothetical protein
VPPHVRFDNKNVSFVDPRSTDERHLDDGDNPIYRIAPRAQRQNWMSESRPRREKVVGHNKEEQFCEEFCSTRTIS